MLIKYTRYLRDMLLSRHISRFNIFLEIHADSVPRLGCVPGSGVGAMDKRPAVATVQSQAEVGHDVERETSPSRRLLVYPFRRGRWLRIRRRQAPTRSGPAMTETHTLQIRTELP